MIYFCSGRPTPGSARELQTFLMLSYGIFGTYRDQRERFKAVKKERKYGEVGQVESHFLDSGAFSLWTKSAIYAKEHKTPRWAYYDTDEFWQYMDDYAKFVKKNKIAVDLYANVDVIPNPELTYRNQKYLEDKHGLSPVPVIHYRTDLKWLSRYMKEGYKLIGLGGLVGSSNQTDCQGWIAQCFDLVCDQPSRLPRIKLHGFGVTSHKLLIRFPWWSVDSASWAKVGAFGSILVPPKRRGRFVYDKVPYVVRVSWESPAKKHFFTMSPLERAGVEEWLSFIGIPLGKEKNGEVLEVGVVTCTYTRRVANLFYYERLQESLPEWPWPYESSQLGGFGLR